MKIQITLEPRDVEEALIEWVKKGFKEFEHDQLEVKSITSDNGTEVEPHACAVVQITPIPF